MVSSKQIQKILSGMLGIQGFTATGSNSIVTAGLTTLLATAGAGGSTVPLQPSNNANTIGVVVNAPTNRVEIYNATTKLRIANTTGEEVYGRIVEAGNVYTLEYYYINGTGTETAYTFPADTDIDFYFGYRFSFRDYPTDAAIAIPIMPPQNDPSFSVLTNEPFVEPLTVTAINTVNNLSQAPASTASVVLYVNGVAYQIAGGAFTCSAAGVLNWVAAAAGFDLETTDIVFAQYAIQS